MNQPSGRGRGRGDHESRFLEARNRREAEKKNDGADEAELEAARVAARAAFIADVAKHEADIAAALHTTATTRGAHDTPAAAEEECHNNKRAMLQGRLDAAWSRYQSLQILIDNGAQLVEGLPTHELRKANAALQSCLALINDFRATYLSTATAVTSGSGLSNTHGAGCTNPATQDAGGATTATLPGLGAVDSGKAAPTAAAAPPTKKFGFSKGVAVSSSAAAVPSIAAGVVASPLQETAANGGAMHTTEPRRSSLSGSDDSAASTAPPPVAALSSGANAAAVVSGGAANVSVAVGPPPSVEGVNGAEDHRSLFRGLCDETRVIRGTNETPSVPLRAAFVRQCRNSIMCFAPIGGSIFLTDCVGCTVYVACHQLRIKSCHDCHFYVWCLSTPVIEHSDGLAFGSISAWRGLLTSASAASSVVAPDDVTTASTFPPSSSSVPTAASVTTSSVGDDEPLEALRRSVKGTAFMDRSVEHFERSHRIVDDFSWLRAQRSPNWRVLDPAEYRISDATSS